MPRKAKGEKPMTSGERGKIKNKRYRLSKNTLAKFLALFRSKEVSHSLPKKYRVAFNNLLNDEDWEIIDFVEIELKLTKQYNEVLSNE